MESTATLPRRRAVSLPPVRWEAVSAWAATCGLIAYLALSGGGFDPVVRGDVAVLVWWVVLLLAVAGLAPRLGAPAWAAAGVLAAWTAWTALGAPGSESAERTIDEAARLATYLGVLVVALALQGRAGARHVLHGAAAAAALVTVLAVLSRLHPQWFPANDQLRFLPESARRLSYPLNYWNALAAFIGMGACLLLGVAATARTVAGRALAAAVLPVSALAVFLCISRGGTIVLVAGVVVFLLLAADRLPQLLTLGVAGLGGALLIAAADQRPAVKAGVDTAAARSDGGEVLVLCVLVCVGVALLHVAIGLLARHTGRPRLLVTPWRGRRIVVAASAAALVAAVLAAGVPGELADRWREFKTPPAAARAISSADVFARLQNTAGQGRYQFWAVAMDAFRDQPVTGTGGGTFGLWWSRHATIDGAIHDAHSLYAQTLAETGAVGGVLLAALVLLSVGGGAFRALRARDPAQRTLLAAATAAIALFWLDATIEWIWQLAVLPALLAVLIGVVLGPWRPSVAGRGGPWARALLAVLAIASLAAVIPPLVTARQLHHSQAEAKAGRLAAALRSARTAQRLQPYAASPRLQEALVLEAAGALRPAGAAARRATAAEPTSWQAWLIRSRIEARLGEAARAVRSFRTARRLNPRSPLFSK